MANKTKIKLAYLLIVLSIILISVQLYDLDYSTADWKDYLSPLSSVLLILAMLVSIKDLKKLKDE